MSGLEPVGIVLGAIPLVVKALEQYRDGVAVIKNMRNFEYIFGDLHTQLELSVVILTNSCYHLLGQCNIADAQMSDLILSRNIHAWSDPDLQQAIKAKLDDNYGVFVSGVKILNKKISLLRKKLKLDDETKPPWLVPDGSVDEKVRRKFFRSAWTRIRGGSEAEKYSALLQEIDRDIEKISKLTTASLRSEPLRVDKKSRLSSVYWHNIRDQAQHLFHSLSSRLEPCCCNYPHKANLRLDVRRTENKDDRPARFAFLLTFERSTCEIETVPWTWRDIEIESVQRTSLPLSSPSPSPQRHTGNTAQRFPTITISEFEQACEVKEQACEVELTHTLESKIEDLCRALTDGNKPDRCLGVLEDQLWRDHVYTVSGPGTRHVVSEAVPLSDMICGRESIGSRQKCMLALTLASSVLQLHDTPWLPRAWGTKDILILKSHSGVPIPSQFYVSQTFTPTATQQAELKRNRIVKNEIVFALGVALLELAFGEPITSFIEPDDLAAGGDDIVTKLSVAMRLVEKLADRESENYTKATWRCVMCNFDTLCLDFEHLEFKERFYEGVVVPLQKDYAHVTGTTL